MLTLIGWELKKLLKRKITFAAIIGALLITVFNACGISYESTGFSSFTMDGERIGEAEGVAMNKALAEEYEGVFTDAAVAEIIERFNLNEAIEEINSGESSAIRMRNAGKYDCNILTSLVMHKMISEDGTVKSVREVFGSSPVYFGYSGSYSEIINDLSIENIVLMLAVIVLLAPLFSDERATKMDRILLSAQCGRKKTAAAKCITALIAAAFLYGACFLIDAGVNIAIFGTEGANVSAAVSLLSAGNGYVMPVWEVLTAAVVTGFAGVLFCALLAVVLSAWMSSFLTLIVAAVILYVPIVILQMPVTNPVMSSLLPLSYCGVSTLSIIYESSVFFKNVSIIIGGALAGTFFMALISCIRFKRSQVS